MPLNRKVRGRHALQRQDVDEAFWHVHRRLRARRGPQSRELRRHVPVVGLLDALLEALRQRFPRRAREIVDGVHQPVALPVDDRVDGVRPALDARQDAVLVGRDLALQRPRRAVPQRRHGLRVRAHEAALDGARSLGRRPVPELQDGRVERRPVGPQHAVAPAHRLRDDGARHSLQARLAREVCHPFRTRRAQLGDRLRAGLEIGALESRVEVLRVADAFHFFKGRCSERFFLAHAALAEAGRGF